MKEDKIVAHLTHVAEMEKKCESLASMTSNLKSVIQNKVISGRKSVLFKIVLFINASETS